MKIALIHYSAPPIVGGVETVLLHQTNLMAAAGHLVKVIVGRGAPWNDQIPVTVLPTIDSRHPDVLAVKADLDRGKVSAQFNSLVETLTQDLNLLLKDTEIVILHNVCSLHKNLALTAALHRLNEITPHPHFILWHHDLAWTTLRYRAELHDGYPWDLLRTPWKHVTQVAVSDMRGNELAELMQLNLNAITVIPNGVTISQLLKLESQTQELINKLALADAEPLLLLPARLTPRKNIELALKVLAVLRHDFPHAALVVTGPEGPHNPANAAYKQTLLTLRDTLGLKNAAHFLAEHTTEFLPDAVIADFFRLADALLFPSREEGFGLPLIEAAITRLPIFCTNITPLRDLGESDVSFFSPDADPVKVAQLIVTRLNSDAAFCFASRVKRRYTWEAVYTASIAPLLESAFLYKDEDV